MLSDFIKRSPGVEQEQGFSFTLRQMVQQASAHIGALAELFGLELQEYGELAKRRYLFLLIALGASMLCYFALWAMLIILLWESLGPYIALASFTLFHFIVALLFGILGWRTKLGPLAPMTREELKSDITCIKLSVKENTKP